MYSTDALQDAPETEQNYEIIAKSAVSWYYCTCHDAIHRFRL